MKLWNDIDIFSVRKDIQKKMDLDDFKYDSTKKEESINNIELALIKLSKDLENANWVFNNMFQDVEDLKEINWNVIVGKK